MLATKGPSESLGLGGLVGLGEIRQPERVGAQSRVPLDHKSDHAGGIHAPAEERTDRSIGHGVECHALLQDSPQALGRFFKSLADWLGGGYLPEIPSLDGPGGCD